MTLKIAILSLVTLLGAVVQRAEAAYASRSPSHDQPFNILKLSDLRSAYLQRAGVVRYDESNATPEGLRQQLQHHFDVVLSLLDLATPESIDVALVRLEVADAHTWTADERTASRQMLRAARLVQLQRLAAYRDHGIFPLNEGQSAQPAPIFVDRHGTACAVGHLMRCSGWTNEVDSIAQSSNLVYVPDATDSAIAAWVLTSGLTLEEAALVQPRYAWPLGQFDASAYEPGEAALEKDGLRYTNFKLQADNYPLWQGTVVLIPLGGPTPTLAGLGLSAGKGTFIPGSGFPLHVPIGTHWIAVGGSTAGLEWPLHSLDASAAGAPFGFGYGLAQKVVISFDVAPMASDQRINGIAETSYSVWQGVENLDRTDIPPPDAIYSLKTTAFDGPTALASVSLDQAAPPSYFGKWSNSKSFTGTQQVSVESTLWLQNGVALDTYLIDFNVVTVPEPTSGFLAAALIATCGLMRRRERNS
jgi:hypothetical protein